MDEERLGQRVYLRESSGDSKAGAVCDLVVQAACPIVTCPSACDFMGDGEEQDASSESSTLMPSLHLNTRASLLSGSPGLNPEESTVLGCGGWRGVTQMK